jgi:hypothetical protein
VAPHGRRPPLDRGAAGRNPRRAVRRAASARADRRAPALSGPTRLNDDAPPRLSHVQRRVPLALLREPRCPSGRVAALRRRGSAPSQSRSRFGLFVLKVGRLVALGHHPVTSGPAIALEQAPNLLQRLLVVTSRLPIRRVSDTHQEPPPSSGTAPQNFTLTSTCGRVRRTPDRHLAQAIAPSPTAAPAVDRARSQSPKRAVSRPPASACSAIAARTPSGEAPESSPSADSSAKRTKIRGQGRRARRKPCRFAPARLSAAYERTVRGSPKCSNRAVSANQVIAAPASPSSVSTNRPEALAMPVCASGV